jgi:hypothetical protein
MGFFSPLVTSHSLFGAIAFRKFSCHNSRATRAHFARERIL